MGDRYYASVTFPATAKKILEVRDWLKSDSTGCEFTEGPDEIFVSDDDANYGRIDITEVLDQHRVPYDHRHEGGEYQSTVYVRFPADALEHVTNRILGNSDRKEVEIDDSDQKVIDYAARLLTTLDLNGVDAVRKDLELMAAREAPALGSLDWKPPTVG